MPRDLQFIEGDDDRKGSLMICHNSHGRHDCDDNWAKVDAGAAAPA